MLIPEIILQKDAFINIEFKEKFPSANADKVILFTGNRSGFFSFANTLLYLLAALKDPFLINEIPFISTKNVSIKVILNNNITKNNIEDAGMLTATDSTNFSWVISENNLSLIAGYIQSLGYIGEEVKIDHLHIDKGISRDGISIYCQVQQKVIV